MNHSLVNQTSGFLFLHSVLYMELIEFSSDALFISSTVLFYKGKKL
jgi:hypothetical protein